MEVNAVVSRRLSISSSSLVCRNAWQCLCFTALDSIFSMKAWKQGFESLVFLKSGIHIWKCVKPIEMHFPKSPVTVKRDFKFLAVLSLMHSFPPSGSWLGSGWLQNTLLFIVWESWVAAVGSHKKTALHLVYLQTLHGNLINLVLPLPSICFQVGIYLRWASWQA